MAEQTKEPNVNFERLESRPSKRSRDGKPTMYWYRHAWRSMSSIINLAKKDLEYKKSVGHVANERAKQEVLDFYDRKCAHCGFSDVRALQVDHINGGGKKHRKQFSYQVHFYRDILEHPEDFQILCANCNWIKRSENREYRE